MKFTIDQSSDYTDVEITIKCGVVDSRLEKMISQIRLYSFSVTGKKDGCSYTVPLEKVYYFESVDDVTFIYTKDDIFETTVRLYEFQQKFADSRFVRISKSCILNTEQLCGVKALLNGKYEVQLKNGEKLIISRYYVPAFKEKFNSQEDIK